MLEAFAVGSGGRLGGPDFEGGPAVFYGTVGIERLFNQARTRGAWIYGDNAYFDRSRGRYFRFARNAFQPSTLCPPDASRLKALGLSPRPWRRDGRHIVIVEQSEHFLALSGAGRDWLARTIEELRRYTDRELRVRPWRRDKDNAARSLVADLCGAWALVTHMSAAANEALLSGVPAFVTGACAASPLSGELSDIERPIYPDNREVWAAGLAGQQWTREEIGSGMAWSALRG